MSCQAIRELWLAVDTTHNSNYRWTVLCTAAQLNSALAVNRGPELTVTCTNAREIKGVLCQGMEAGPLTDTHSNVEGTNLGRGCGARAVSTGCQPQEQCQETNIQERAELHSAAASDKLLLQPLVTVLYSADSLLLLHAER